MRKEYIYNRGFDHMRENIENTSCGIYPAPMDAQVAINVLADYLLGEDWYVVDPIGVKQVNAIVAEQILDRYCKQWRRDWKHYEKESDFN